MEFDTFDKSELAIKQIILAPAIITDYRNFGLFSSIELHFLKLYGKQRGTWFTKEGASPNLLCNIPNALIWEKILLGSLNLDLIRSTVLTSIAEEIEPIFL